MDLHIKLEHNLVHKIRFIFKGYILIMYPCVAFVVSFLVALAVAAVSVPPVVAGAAGAGVAVAVGAAVTVGAGVAVGVGAAVAAGAAVAVGAAVAAVAAGAVVAAVAAGVQYQH